ncbi:MAG: hypothetical protein C4290_06975, partial [Chloroflexota bacterium]
FTLRVRAQEGVAVRIEAVPQAATSAPAGSIEVDGVLVSVPPLAPPRPFLTTHRVVSFYGTPLTGALGVLGEQSPEATVARLRAQAAAYEPLSTERAIVPAFHLLYAVAQGIPGPDGTYLQRLDDATVEHWVQLAREHGFLVFLDVQVGKSSVERELPRLFKFLVDEHVHVALDPEFAWGETGEPGEHIGHLTGPQINQAQALLQRFAIEHKLPTKILIVHQFLSGMVKRREVIRRFDRVELVFDADGFGPRHVKRGLWEQVIVDNDVELAGIKLFYKFDPDLMTPADVLSLSPKPVVVIYQ